MASSNRNKVAVAIIHHKSVDTSYEQISLRHAEKFFKNYDVYAVVPSGVNLLKRFRQLRVGDHYFSSLGNNNHLRLSARFYDYFSRYDYLLIYELDSLIFAENIADFCTDDYDYIGAPWVSYEQDKPVGFSGVGNSGFSLRRIEACLQVLNSKQKVMDPSEYWQKIGSKKSRFGKVLGVVGAMSKLMDYRNDVQWFVQQYIDSPQRTWSPHEDKFWLLHAQKFYQQFRCATIEQALPFAFEHAPEFCFERNNSCLPLGCHAWFKHDENFWQPYLLN